MLDIVVVNQHYIRLNLLSLFHIHMLSIVFRGKFKPPTSSERYNMCKLLLISALKYDYITIYHYVHVFN